jgi:hypothetical protein
VSDAFDSALSESEARDPSELDVDDRVVSAVVSAVARAKAVAR